MLYDVMLNAIRKEILEEIRLSNAGSSPQAYVDGLRAALKMVEGYMVRTPNE